MIALVQNLPRTTTAFLQGQLVSFASCLTICLSMHREFYFTCILPCNFFLFFAGPTKQGLVTLFAETTKMLSYKTTATAKLILSPKKW